MKKSVIIVLLICLMPCYIHAQVNFCDTILKQAYRDLAGKSKNSIELALKKLNDAERCDYTNTLLKERQTLQAAIFDTIKSGKIQLEVLNKDLEKQQNKLSKQNASLIEQKASLEKQRQRIDSLFTIAKNQAFKSAPSEYARLIHDGPSEVNDNETKYYDSSYLIAYSKHFDQLKDSIEKINLGNKKDPLKDTAAIKIYRSIRDKLYYDNELYERVYAALERSERNDSRNTVIKEEDSSRFTSIKENNLHLVKHFKSLTEIATSGESKCTGFSCCYTDDNYIYICRPSEKSDTIYMGAKVTALDYNEAAQIIYFGTSGGYFGYLKYSLPAQKYQPIFQNKLESEITAIQFFDYTDSSLTRNSFLLAVAKNSSSRLYKLDGSLKNEQHLIGNILPYKKEFGEINHAVFDQDRGKIILNTLLKGKQFYYAWNPFTYNLLPQLKADKNFKIVSDKIASSYSDPYVQKTNLLMTETKIY